MKLCYQAATPDVAIADSVTAYQGSLEKSFGDLGRLGYSLRPGPGSAAPGSARRRNLEASVL